MNDNIIIATRWIEAGKIIAVDPHAKVLCPECQREYLKVMDTTNEANNVIIERHMVCNNCKAYNALRLNRRLP